MEQAVVQVVENRADIDGRVLAVAPIVGTPRTAAAAAKIVEALDVAIVLAESDDDE